MQQRIKQIRDNTGAAQGTLRMSDEGLEVVFGSGNVFRDLAIPDADLEQARALLAAEIIGVLDERGLSVKAAETATGIAASEFSQIRKAKLGRFTLDRMITILGKLDRDVDIRIEVRPRAVLAAQ